MQMVYNGQGRSGERHGGWKKAETMPLAIHLPPNKGVQLTASSVPLVPRSRFRQQLTAGI
jgi:hypothetical protein